MTLKICLLSPQFHPAIGGAETHVRTLGEGLVRLGHQVTVLTDKGHEDSPGMEWISGIEILRTSHLQHHLDRLDCVAWEESLFGLLREFRDSLGVRQFDLIHAHCQASAVLAGMIKGALGCKLVVSMHETQPELDPFGESRTKMVYSHIPYDAIIACSEYFRDQAIRYGASPNLVQLVYYSVDLRRFNTNVPRNRIRTLMGIDNSQSLVLLVGRFKARKGIIEFVRAISQALTAVPKIRGLIVGSCDSASLEYSNLVRAEIRRLGLESSVSIIDGELGLDEMPEVFSAADLVVQPSHAEGLGIAILEAMAMRRPVIGAAVSGIQEIIRHEENGLLVAPHSVEALASSIIYLLAHPEEARSIADRGYSFVRTHFGIDRMLQRTLDVYHQVLGF